MAENNKIILEVKELSKSFNTDVFALKELSFILEKESICAIVGPSGSGKTTLLRLIAGLEIPDTGSIRIADKEVTSNTKIIPPQKRNVGMVFQDLALFPHLTIAENICYGVKKKDPKQLEELLVLIKLSGYNKRYPHELSGGEQQRVALARTLAVAPKILLLDEPFSSLDSDLKQGLRLEIKQIVKQLGLSMIFITHDIQDAAAISDTVLVLEKGSLVVEGSHAELVAHNHHYRKRWQNATNSNK